MNLKLKNLAAVLTKQKRKLSLCKLEIEEIPKGYVLLKMIYSGLCHTQLNEINGILGKDKFLPHCMGHEGIGKVTNLGPGIKNFKIGDLVSVSWIKKKTKKKYKPLFYKYNGKKINSGGCNTLLKYSLVSDNRLYKLSKKNKFLRESILLGCAFQSCSEKTIQILGKQIIPGRAPKTFDHIPSCTSKSRCQFLNNLTIASHWPIQSL